VTRFAPLVFARLLTVVVATSLALAACGGDSSGQPERTLRGNTQTAPGSGHDMAGMDMGDATLTPAKDIKGATLVSAPFALLDTRPPGTDAVTGTAYLAHAAATGTTVTIELQHLPAGDYVAHLHADACSAGNGGKHFQFTAGGPASPPNEIHLAFTAKADGTGFMTAHNAKDVGTAAKSIVVHPAQLIDSRLACADF
jgi:hypothetical protein